MPPASFLRRTATTGALAVVALAAAAAPAAAQEGPGNAPVDVALTVSGPTTGAPGGEGAFTVRLSNEGETAAPQVRVTLQLSDGLSVAGAPAVDGWTCVANPFSCDLEGALAPGETAPALPVRIAYGAEAGGREEVAALAHQAAGARVDKATAVVVVERSEPSPAPTTPAPAPTTAPPAPPAPAPTTAAPAPAPTTAAPAPAAPAPAPAPAAPAEEPVEEPVAAPVEELGEVVEPAPVETEEVPESLPFADDGTADEADEADEPEEVELAARPSAGDGVDDWLVGLFVATFVAFGYCVVAAIAKSRRAQA